MGIGYIAGGNGGGGVTSDEVTARRENVIEGKTTITAESDNAVVGGTMKYQGRVNHTLSINGSFTIPKGYHDGTGKVTQNIQTRKGETFYPAGSNITISKNQYLTGDLIIHAITQSGLVSGNIMRGKTIIINNGKQDVWKVAGSNEVMRVRTGYAEKGNGTNKTFSLQRVGETEKINYRMYYMDINLGITPAYVISMGGGFIMWRYGNRFNLVANVYSIGGEQHGHLEFINPSDAPFKANQCRVFYGEYKASEPYNVWCTVIGY